MADSRTAALTRVTIAAPRSRIDLALPSDVPLAELLPTLLRLAGAVPADDPDGRHAWSLATLAGPPMDIARSLDSIGIHDGEVLYLRRRAEAAPEPVFDDLVDAIATATRTRPGRWTPVTTRRFGLSLGTLALLGAAAVTLFAGPPHLPGALVSTALAVVLLVGAVIAVRVLDKEAAGVALASASVAHGFVGALLAFPGGSPAPLLSGPALLVGAATALVFTMVALVGVGAATGPPVFLAVATVAAMTGLGALLETATDLKLAQVVAVVGGIAVAVTTSAPLAAARLARLSVPPVPVTPEELASSGAEPIDGAIVLARTRSAAALLAGVFAGLAAGLAGVAAVLAASGDPAALGLAALIALLMLLRARSFSHLDQRLPWLCGGVLAFAAVAVAGFFATDLRGRLLVIVVALLVAASVGIGAAAGRPSDGAPSPYLARCAELVETTLLIGLVPMIGLVSGLFEWARTLPG